MLLYIYTHSNIVHIVTDVDNESATRQLRVQIQLAFEGEIPALPSSFFRHNDLHWHISQYITNFTFPHQTKRHIFTRVLVSREKEWGTLFGNSEGERKKGRYCFGQIWKERPWCCAVLWVSWGYSQLLQVLVQRPPGLR